MTDAINVEPVIVEQVPVPAEATPEQPWPSTAASYYAIFVFVIVVMFTIVDRQVLSLLVEPIKADFHLSDTKIALLLGAAFSLTYAVAGLPLAKIADHVEPTQPDRDMPRVVERGDDGLRPGGELCSTLPGQAGHRYRRGGLYARNVVDGGR